MSRHINGTAGTDAASNCCNTPPRRGPVHAKMAASFPLVHHGPALSQRGSVPDPVCHRPHQALKDESPFPDDETCHRAAYVFVGTYGQRGQDGSRTTPAHRTLHDRFQHIEDGLINRSPPLSAPGPACAAECRPARCPTPHGTAQGIARLRLGRRVLPGIPLIYRETTRPSHTEANPGRDA